ncbi:MAG: hypothetical protein DRJ42_04150 [Deltaproteobacteria bacterium]|nr:MAG: hypothetical protein DRJ42_04150 [Deltaproteobacteria bacterium]
MRVFVSCLRRVAWVSLVACGGATTVDGAAPAGGAAGLDGTAEEVAVAPDPPEQTEPAWPTDDVRRLPPIQVDTARVRSRIVTDWDADALVPTLHPELSGTRRGIVMASDFGVTSGRRAYDARIQRTPSYRFYTEGSSGYAPYWATGDEHGINPMTWRVVDAQHVEHDVRSAMLGPSTPNPWGLHRRAHLVEVEAELPTQSNSGLHFVVRDARILDGTQAYPLVVEDAVTQLHARFRDQVEAVSAEVERILGQGRARVPAGYEARIPDGPQLQTYPSWLDDERALEVTIIARYREAHIGPRERRMSQCRPCRRSGGRPAPCPRCNPQPYMHEPQVFVGWQMAARYRVGHDARLIREVLMQIKPY